MLLALAPNLSKLTSLAFSPIKPLESPCAVLPTLRHLTALEVSAATLRSQLLLMLSLLCKY